MAMLPATETTFYLCWCACRKIFIEYPFIHSFNSSPEWWGIRYFYCKSIQKQIMYFETKIKTSFFSVSRWVTVRRYGNGLFFAGNKWNLCSFRCSYVILFGERWSIEQFHFSNRDNSRLLFMFYPTTISHGMKLVGRQLDDYTVSLKIIIKLIAVVVDHDRPC